MDGQECFGVFVDTSEAVQFDTGYTDMDRLDVTVPGKNYDLYILREETPLAIAHRFRRLIGKSYVPPKWAFGYGQSRWSYMNAAEVREVVRRHRDNHNPLDAVYLDIDYMERYKDFTVDETRFPDFRQFAMEMRAEGIHLVPIIDAGVKTEEGYKVYEGGGRGVFAALSG